MCLKILNHIVSETSTVCDAKIEQINITSSTMTVMAQIIHTRRLAFYWVIIKFINCLICKKIDDFRFILELTITSFTRTFVSVQPFYCWHSTRYSYFYYSNGHENFVLFNLKSSNTSEHYNRTSGTEADEL